MSEARLRDYLVRNIDDRLHLIPIENHAAGPGVPDFAYTINSVNGWLELKYGTPRKPPKFRPTQFAFLRRNLYHNGDPLVLCCIDEGEKRTFGLIHGSRAISIHKTTGIEPWIKAMGFTWFEGRITWPELLHLLEHPDELRT